ncbi:MAG: ABC transporter ATP-binding protein [bacterium]
MKKWFWYFRQSLAYKSSADHLPIKGKLNYLKPVFVRYWRGFLVGLGLLMLLAPLSFIYPLISRYFIDTVLIGRKLDLFFIIILLLVGVKIIEKIGGVIQQYYLASFSQKVTLSIQASIFDRVLHFPKEFFDTKENGYLLSRLTQDLQEFRGFLSGTSVQIISGIIRFAVGVVILFRLEWRLALASLAIVPFLFWSTRYFSKQTRALSHGTLESQAVVSQITQQALASIPLIKSFAAEETETRRLAKGLGETKKSFLMMTTYWSFSNFAISSLNDLGRFLPLAIGCILVATGNWTLGSLYAFIACQGLVLNPVQSLAYLNFRLQRNLAALERVGAFYDIIPEEKEGKEITKLAGKIDFKNVCFSYDSRETVLENITFTIDPGEHVALIGPSGTGKTTLGSLILGFYRSGQGEILFDGQPMTLFAISSLRQRIGYVPQQTLLLSGTISDNLRYGNNSADRIEIEKAAKTAGIHDFIVSLPKGYDEVLGENGVNLSEGQKQRLSIARALVKDPDILLFDEPTSFLDVPAEESLFEALPAAVARKTLVVIAHRPSSIKKADRILVLAGKRLQAEGEHDLLLASNDYYRSIVGQH